jgi:hypothetical protein
MRKRLVSGNQPSEPICNDWLNLERLIQVEVTSEDAGFPIEAAFGLGTDRTERGWRAAEPGEQLIRLLFDDPQRLRRIFLYFVERDRKRTQEFVLRWSSGGNSFKEIVRQQWNFSPQGAMSELEDYQVDLAEVSAIELVIIPDISGGDARASLAQLRLA